MKVPYEYMTPENTPYPRPLSESAKAKALEYIRKCEEGPNGHTFKNFESQIRAYTETFKTSRMVFNHTFVEYVILEVTLRNYSMWVPPRGCEDALADRISDWLLYAECLYRCGANPKSFADIHHELINDALIKARVACSFRCCRYWILWKADKTPSQSEIRHAHNLLLECRKRTS